MNEKQRQEFADEMRSRDRDWSFRWVGNEKVFTDPAVQKEWVASHGN